MLSNIPCYVEPRTCANKKKCANLREKPLLGSPQDFCRIPSKFVRDSLPEGSRKVIKGQVGIPRNSRLFAFVAAACFGWLLASEFGLASGLLAGLLLALLLLAGWECWWAALSVSLCLDSDTRQSQILRDILRELAWTLRLKSGK